MTRLIECCSFARRQSPKPWNTTIYILYYKTLLKIKEIKKGKGEKLKLYNIFSVDWKETKKRWFGNMIHKVNRRLQQQNFQRLLFLSLFVVNKEIRNRIFCFGLSFFRGQINPFISITPSKPFMSWLTLHNCEIYYFSIVNYNPATTGLIFIRVNIYPGQGGGGLTANFWSLLPSKMYCLVLACINAIIHISLFSFCHDIANI